MGGNQFCLKACDPAGPDAAKYCEHVFDRIGCKYNAPAAYQDGAFLSCKGANQDFPGVYTGSNGQVTTYSQPPESLGAIATMPYEPKLPSTSECQTYTSAQIYANAPDASISSSSATSKPTGTTSTPKASAANTQTSTTTGAAARGVSVGAVGPLVAALAASLLAGIAL